MIGEFSAFLQRLLQLILSLLPIFALTWLATFVVLVALFKGVKNRVRARVTHFDETIRVWAQTLRFKTIDEATQSERVARTWFFRFWTNFASAPSLSVISLLFPFFIYHRVLQFSGDPATAFHEMKAWLFPGLCYAGSMLLSFVIKKVFNRVRPPRKEHAFGYKLKDASFPSGHSLTAFCFWISLALVISLSGLLPFTASLAFTILAVLIIGLTGLSRVYMGVHFPSDVMGGYFIGVLWCVVWTVATYGRLAA